MMSTLDVHAYTNSTARRLCSCLVQLASTWWSSRVKALQLESGLANKQANGMVVLEAVPQAPDYWWPADPVFRKIGSGGQGSVY